MRYKRALALALVLVMAALAACGENTDAPDAKEREAPIAGEMPQGELPEKPSGEMPQGEPPERPDGEVPQGEPPERPGREGFGGESFTQGKSANTLTQNAQYIGEKYVSTGDDENALRVDAAEVSLSNVTVEKAAGKSSNTEAGDFYGVNAALLATSGARVSVSGAKISSVARNGNGVFSYGEGTCVSISDSMITTAADNSGGLQTAGGGTTEASNLTVTTKGDSSAAIRSDRGGGTVNVTGGSYRSEGLNSPAVYSTANITVKKASLKAAASEALVIEGKNSITLDGCTVSGSMSKSEGASSDENVHNIMLYQSMSGDADVGTTRLSVTGGSITGESGDMFYVTNTRAVIALCNVELRNNDEGAYLLRVCGNSGKRGWGKQGENGAQVDLTADSQRLEGNILVDSISTLSLTLKNGSSFTGSISLLENGSGADAKENACVIVGEGCTWTLTGDCTLTSLENNGLIDFNGYSISFADGSVMR